MNNRKVKRTWILIILQNHLSFHYTFIEVFPTRARIVYSVYEVTDNRALVSSWSDRIVVNIVVLFFWISSMFTNHVLGNENVNPPNLRATAVALS